MHPSPALYRRALFLAALSFGLAAGHSEAASISVDWANGSGGVGATPVMGPAEVAGVVPAANWNSFAIQTSPASGSATNLINDSGVATTAGASWTYNNPWSINITDTAGNLRMMRGYLDSAAATTTVVSLTGIPYALYDVYVYADGDNGAELRSGAYTIGATTLVNTDPANTNFGGTFIEGTNYVRFTGLTGANFTLNATPTGVAATPRAPINGIQIVQVPEPGSLALGAMGALVLARRRRSRR